MIKENKCNDSVDHHSEEDECWQDPGLWKHTGNILIVFLLSEIYIDAQHWEETLV